MRVLHCLACALIVVLSIGCQSTAPNEAAAVASTDEGAPEEFDNTLKWTTASEVNNFGYHIYRSLKEDGPFERITSDPIPGAGTTDEPTSYVFVDDTIDPTSGYWYFIESISMSGMPERFSPITYIEPKAPVED